MAANESSLGLKKIEIGAVTPTGLPLSWVELEDVKIGTASLTETEATTTNIFVEQQASVYRNLTSEEGVITLQFELYDVSPANLALLKGGTVSAATSSIGSTWKKGSTTTEITKAVKVTTLDNFVLTIPNGKLVANINWIMTKEELATVSVIITAQTPLDSSLGALQVEAPDKTA